VTGVTVFFKDRRTDVTDVTIVIDVTEVTDVTDVTNVSEYVLGDANNDHVMSIADVMVAVNVILYGTDNPAALAYADLDGDGNVSISDVMGLIEMVFSFDYSDTAVNVGTPCRLRRCRQCLPQQVPRGSAARYRGCICGSRDAGATSTSAR